MAVTVQELLTNAKYKDEHCLVLLDKQPGREKPKTERKPPKYFKDFVKKQEKFNEDVRKFIKEQKYFNQKVLKFIEAQTKFNEFVVKQFEVHGWTEKS